MPDIFRGTCHCGRKCTSMTEDSWTGLPQVRRKHLARSCVSAQELLRYRQHSVCSSEPTRVHGAVLCFSRRALSVARWLFPDAEEEAWPNDLLVLPSKSNLRLAISGGFGIGSPATAVQCEELIALGASRFISIGTAGSLWPNIGPGCLVICDRAIRDEGTSFHYAPPRKYAMPSAPLTRYMISAMSNAATDLHIGTTWTTDAPYRETPLEVETYTSEGVLTVDMEASALFTVAAYHGVHASSAFVISDQILGCRWVPNFQDSAVEAGLEVLLASAVDALSRCTTTPLHSAGETDV
jgi:uridine phosphorylase